MASAKDYPDGGYDLVCVFDCLHDMGDPVGASAHVLETLDSDGTWMIVEPFANDRPMLAVRENQRDNDTDRYELNRSIQASRSDICLLLRSSGTSSRLPLTSPTT